MGQYGLALEQFKGLISSSILLFLGYRKIKNNKNNFERNFAKIVEILDHQNAGPLSKQTSDPAYHITD